MTELISNLTICEIGVYLLVKTSDDVFAIDDIRDRYGPEAYTAALFLVKEGLLLNDGGDLAMPVKGKQKMSGVAAIFEEARKHYPGSKDGHKPMFDWFKRKAEDYKSEVNLILPAIKKEEEYKAYLKRTGKLCPDWKNFKTWIGNRCWLQEFPEFKPNDEVYSEAYSVYLRRKEEVCPTASSVSPALFEQWINKTGEFAGIDRRMSTDGQRMFFWRHHGANTDRDLRSEYARIKDN